jgi:hypothetical protein
VYIDASTRASVKYESIFPTMYSPARTMTLWELRNNVYSRKATPFQESVDGPDISATVMQVEKTNLIISDAMTTSELEYFSCKIPWE